MNTPSPNNAPQILAAMNSIQIDALLKEARKTAFLLFTQQEEPQDIKPNTKSKKVSTPLVIPTEAQILQTLGNAVGSEQQALLNYFLIGCAIFLPHIANQKKHLLPALLENLQKTPLTWSQRASNISRQKGSQDPILRFEDAVLYTALAIEKKVPRANGSVSPMVNLLETQPVKIGLPGLFLLEHAKGNISKKTFSALSLTFSKESLSATTQYAISLLGQYHGSLGSEKSNEKRAKMLFLLLDQCFQSGISAQDLAVRSTHILQTFLQSHDLQTQTTQRTFISFLEQYLMHPSMIPYKGTNPLFLLATSPLTPHSPDLFNVFLKAGFTLDASSAPEGFKIKNPKGPQGILYQWVQMHTAYHSDVLEDPKKLTAFLQTCSLLIASGADVHEKNPSGKGLLRVINLALRNLKQRGSKAQIQALESVFEFFVQQGLSVQSILPQKELVQEAGSSRIAQLIETQMEKLALLEALDTAEVQKALDLYRQQKEKDTPDLISSKTRRL